MDCIKTILRVHDGGDEDNLNSTFVNARYQKKANNDKSVIMMVKDEDDLWSNFALGEIELNPHHGHWRLKKNI